MFGRSVQMKFVKDSKPTEGDPNRNQFEGPEIAAAYSMVAKDFITHAALVVGGVFIVYKIVGRICK